MFSQIKVAAEQHPYRFVAVQWKKGAWVMGVFDVVPGAAKVDTDLAAWVEGKLKERFAARQARDFARADAIRKEVEGRGVEVEDTPQGPKWRLR